MQEKPYVVLAYYGFTPIEDPHAEVKAHKEFFKDKDVSSRIYISEQGINGKMCAFHPDALAYMNWMQTKPSFEKIQFKLHSHHEHVFPRKTVKYRKQLVAIDREVDMSLTGEHVSPKRWKEMLNSPEKPLLIDVRNDYEWKIGHFKGAELPQCENFREFNDYADNLKETVDLQKTPVMMYCTGGIRCELYSSILKEKGFEKVYQLDGGVINYGLQEGSDQWVGKLFVFDDRIAVPLSETPEEQTIIGKCKNCGTLNDTYYNCANIDCNALFLCCSNCVTELTGCCSIECQQGNRVRPYHVNEAHKPFRRWHVYEAEKKVNS